MRFLADESCDFAVVRALRAAGHDVAAVAEISPRADDEIVTDQAVREERLPVTEDKDFGQLVYADKRASGGVLFPRVPGALSREPL
jgi:predicted nuclease of predicted toxin-antitoxin system